VRKTRLRRWLSSSFVIARNAAAAGSSASSAACLASKRLGSVRRLYQGLHSFRSMMRMEASLTKARALRLRFSQSLARRRQRFNQAIVRSTIQRLGNGTNPFGAIGAFDDFGFEVGQDFAERRMEN
jgi:hypothetical protein